MGAGDRQSTLGNEQRKEFEMNWDVIGCVVLVILGMFFGLVALLAIASSQTESHLYGSESSGSVAIGAVALFSSSLCFYAALRIVGVLR